MNGRKLGAGLFHHVVVYTLAASCPVGMTLLFAIPWIQPSDMLTGVMKFVLSMCPYPLVMGGIHCAVCQLASRRFPAWMYAISTGVGAVLGIAAMLAFARFMNITAELDKFLLIGGVVLGAMAGLALGAYWSQGRPADS